MSSPFDPRHNFRVFAAGSAASVRAATRWIGGDARVAAGAWTVLIEGVDGPLPRPAPGQSIELVACSDRRALSGQAKVLMEYAAHAARTEPALGEALGAALAAFRVRLEEPPATRVMGIVNVTPDSFSDGGQFADADAAVRHGLAMAEAGAQILDIGGESTRPGAVEVPADEELARVLPVVKALRGRTEATLSIDTRKAAVAEACLEAGADWINDVSGLSSEPALAEVVARYPEAHLVLMHSRKKPEGESFSTEYDAEGKPIYEDVVADTCRWLRRQCALAVERGVAPERLWIDPGFGFGKTPDQNVELLRRLREYTAVGPPVLVGTSRKSTVGRLLGDLPADQRLEGNLATVAAAVLNGAAAVRVHDVREMARVVRVADALR
jgi:dihydropteroate synthase